MTNSSATPQFDLSPLSEAQLRELIDGLSGEERRVMLHHGDEAPFCGVLLAEKREGVFTCRLCGLPLFRPARSSRAAPAGRASLPRSMRIICAVSATSATRGRRLRSYAPAVARNRATSSTTVRPRAGYVTASTPSRFASRRRASVCPTSCAAVRQKVKCGAAEPSRRGHSIRGQAPFHSVGIASSSLTGTNLPSCCC